MHAQADSGNFAGYQILSEGAGLEYGLWPFWDANPVRGDIVGPSASGLAASLH